MAVMQVEEPVEEIDKEKAKLLRPHIDKAIPDREKADVCIMTDIHGVSLLEVAKAVALVLRKKGLKVKLADWGKINVPEDNIIFVGTLFTDTLNFLNRFLPDKNVIFYAIVEGEPVVDAQAKKIAKQITVISPSQYSKDNIEKSGINVETVIQHGIPLNTSYNKEYYTFLKENMIGKAEQVVLYIAGNQYRKALDKYLLACKVWERLIPEGFAILHSGGAPKGLGYEVANIMQSLNLKRLWFTNTLGLLNWDRVASLYALSSFYCSASMNEGFNLPIIEAYSFGKPVIALDIPPHREKVRHKHTGILIPYQRMEPLRWLGRLTLEIYFYDVDDLIDAMVTLTEPTLQTYMGIQAKKEAEKYDMEKLYSQFTRYIL